MLSSNMCSPCSIGVLEKLEMTTTIIGIIITLLTIEADKFTHYQHRVFPAVALVGVLTIIASLLL